MKLKQIYILGLVTLLSALSNATLNTTDYLKEQPAFLTPCKLHEKPQDVKCFTKALENTFQNWKNGVPGLESFTSIDPFKVKRVRFSNEGENIKMKMELRNMSAYGFSKAKAIQAHVNETDYSMKYQIHLPSLRTFANYKIKGKLYGLSLNTEGLLETNVTDLDFLGLMKSDLVERDGVQFFNVKSFNTDIRKIGNFQVHFTNLFGGNAELEDSANELFNTIWREMFEILKPPLTQAFDAIISDRFKKIFNYMPIKYLISDLP